MNGKVELTANGFAIHVDQSFGNCPQYIQARQFHFRETPATAAPPRTVTALEGAARAVIYRADTFFIASQHLGESAGRARIVWDRERDDPQWRDAQRLVSFELDEGVLLKDAVALRWDYLSQASQFAES